MTNGHGSGLRGSTTMAWASRVSSKSKGYGPDPSCQPCPACGGLECLCRPRFFAGQLLTEQDMNRLDHYIVEKHKLHNRHLFGWGVVCGLEVRCEACDERVSVTPGYALSPCGEDIVVCKPDCVDICELIARCREDDGPICRPYSGNDPCENVEEEWVLAIRYLERPSLPTTPLVGPPSCACGGGGCKGKSCACGGSCGCSPNGAPPFRAEEAKPESPRLRRGAPPSCEPTVTCETYRYDVFRKPEEEKRDPGSDDDSISGSLAGFFEQLEGEMAARIACCLRDLEKSIPVPPGDPNTMTDSDKQAWFRWICAVRQALSNYFGRIGGTDCEAIEKLGAIPLPDPALPLTAFKIALGQALLAMLVLAFEAMLNCICSNALPPCPPPEDPRVPLAVVKIRKSDCHIISVCNWTPLRRHVVTFPTLGYWLGWFPLRRIIREFMEALCCQVFGLPEFEPPSSTPPGTTQPGGPVPSGAAARAAARQPGPQPVDPLAQPIVLDVAAEPAVDPVLAKAFARGFANDATLTTGDLYDLVFKRPAFANPGGLDPEAQEKLVARFAQTGLVKTLSRVARDMTGILPARPAKPSERQEIDALKAAVATQAEEIASLKQRVDRTSGRKPK